jgi:GTP-binding protein
MLTNHKGLAKTSQTPGKTKHIAHFIVNENWFLVDLPGYGYAKVSKEKRTEFRQAILNYIAKRETLHCLYVLVDSRIEPQEIDLKFIEWLGQNEIPFAIVFTKIDKVSKTRSGVNSNAFLDKLREGWDELPPVFYTSAETQEGREELLKHIEQAQK